jgi:DNA-binding MarR family transcriptional regulator
MAKRKTKGRKPNATGRSEGEETHFRLHRSFGQSQVVRRLTGPELKVWIELHTRHNGFNNGAITLSTGECARLLGMSKSTASEALKGLMTKGLIRLAKPGEHLGRKAAEWTLTDQKVGEAMPTRDYQKWVAPAPVKRGAPPRRRFTKTPRQKPALVLVPNAS